jgi:DNA-directed RNA polymerase subunit N (RpoN/RPB10)
MTPISPDQYETVCFTCGACVGKPWVELTEEEIEKIVDLNTSDDAGYDIFCDGRGVARAVIDKLKEKNA